METPLPGIQELPDLLTLREDLDRQIDELERELRAEERRYLLKGLKFWPTQRKYLDAIANPEYRIVLLTSANQFGKSFVAACDLIAECIGYEPWSGRKRPHTPYDIAVLLRDYDSHARKLLTQNFLELLPEDCVRVQWTHSRAPRVIQVRDPLTGRWGKSCYIFTHDQDPARLEGSTWQKALADEPPPREHFVALYRGLQKTGGTFSMVMTPISEPWIYDELYALAGNHGGPKKHVFALTAFPDENLASQGGVLDDRAVAEFRDTLSPEEKEARVHGRWTHIQGRIYKNFDKEVHVIAPEDVPEPHPKDLVYVVCDPHPRTPWAIILAVKPFGTNTWYIVDESPKGVYIETQKHNSQTYQDAAAIIRAFPRTPRLIIMDPNWGKTRSISTGLTAEEEFEQVVRLPVITDINDSLDDGHLRVQELLEYDKERPISTDNQPRLLVSAVCQNVIRGFLNYVWQEWSSTKVGYSKSPNPKPQEKYKHFPDTIRYLAVFTADATVQSITPITRIRANPVRAYSRTPTPGYFYEAI